jgi:hypothetical protein
MSSEFLLDELVNRSAIKADKEFTIEAIDLMITKIKELKNLRVEGATAQDIQSFANAANKSTAAEKQLNDAIKATTEIINKKATATKQLTLEDAKAQEQIKKTNAEIRQQAKEAIAAEGSLEKMRAKLATLNSYKNKLDINSDEYKKAEKDVFDLNESIKHLEQNAGDFRRNVGNYSGALKGPFELLKNELGKVQQQLSQMKQTDPGFKKLESEANILEKVIEGVDKSFGSTKQELRAFTEASKQLGTQFGITNELFQNFVQEVGSRKDELEDIQKTINFNASDTKYIDGILNSVQAVVGAYGAWQSATVLLGNDNEELNKSMQKLQAVLTLVQSIQSITNALQAESGAIQTILAAKTWLVNSARTVENILLGISTTETAANTAVIEANAAAQAAQAGAVGLATVAIEGEAMAAGEATVATIGLRTALITTGIGAIIVALIYGITKLVGAISDWAQADELALENQKLLAESLKELIDLETKIAEIRSYGSKERISSMERELKLQQANGISQEKQLAYEMAIAKEKKRFADEEAARNNVTAETVEKANLKLGRAELVYRSLMRTKEEYVKQQQAQNKKVEDDSKFNKELDKAKAEMDLAQSAFDFQKKIYDTQVSANLEVNTTINSQNKLSADEQRKLTLETTKINAELIIDANDRILNNEHSTLQQRLAAIKSNAAERKAIVEAENKAIQSDPTQSATAKEISSKNLSASIKKINRDEKQELFKINEDYRKKDLAAQLQMQKIIVDENNNLQQQIISSNEQSLDVRLNASAKYNANQKAIIDAEFEYKKATTVLTEKELKALEADHNAKLVELNYNAQKQILDILISTKDKQKKILDEKYNDIVIAYQQEQTLAAQALNAQVQQINKDYQDKKLSRKKYLEQIENAERESAIRIAQIQIDSAKRQLELLGDTDKALLRAIQKQENSIRELENAKTDKQRLAAQQRKELADKEVEVAKDADDKKKKSTKDLSDAQAQLSKTTTDKTIADEDRKKEKFLQTIDYIKQVFDAAVNTVQSILSASIEAQKNAIQEQIDGLDKQKEAAIAAANSQAISESEKADKIAVINANAQAKKEALERRQRELDNKKAKADRTFQIFNIIGNTAIAITKFLADGNIAGSIIAGIIGAAQLAATLATPIPKYAKGGIHNQDGPAWVGDGGKNEIVETPSGETFITPDRPTLINLKKGSKIYSDANAYMQSINETSMIMSLKSAGEPVNSIDFDKQHFKQLENKIGETNSKLSDVVNAVTNIPGVTINNSWLGAQTQIKRGGDYTNWVNDFIKS